MGFYFLTKGVAFEVRILRYLSVDAVSNRMQIKEEPGVFKAEVK